MLSPEELSQLDGTKLWLGMETMVVSLTGLVYTLAAIAKYKVESTGGNYRRRFPSKRFSINYSRMGNSDKKYNFLPEELLPEDFKSQEHKEKEDEQLEQLVRNRLIDQGDLRESRIWYLTRDQSLRFAQMTLEDLKDPNSNTSREISLLEDVLTTSDFQSLIKGKTLDIFDIGSGNGEKAKRIIKHCEQANYIPVDVSPYMIAIATGNLCNEFGLNARQFTIPGILSRLTATGVSPLLIKYNIYNKRKDLRRQRKRLTRLLSDKKLKKYLSKINNDQTIIDKLNTLGQLSEKLRQTEDSLKTLSSELKTCDKRRLLEIYYNIIGENFSVSRQIDKGFESIMKTSAIFYPIRLLQCAIFWCPPAIDYVVGKLTNFRLCEDERFFSPYLFDDISIFRGDSSLEVELGKPDSSHRMYALRQSFRSLFWPKKEKVSRQLDLLIENFNSLTDLKPRTNLDPGEKLNIPSDLVVKDFSQEDIFESMLDVTFRYQLYNNQRLYLFLGQTLGNFSAVERRQIVDKFYETMSSGDMMLVGVELRPQNNTPGFEDHIKLMERNYSGGEDFVASILDASGIQRSDVEYRAVYNRTTNEIEIGYRVIANEVVVKNNQRSRIFRKDEIIPVASSHKFAINEVISLFEPSGFTVVGHKMYTPLRTIEGITKESHPEYEVLLVRK